MAAFPKDYLMNKRKIPLCRYTDLKLFIPYTLQTKR